MANPVQTSPPDIATASTAQSHMEPGTLEVKTGVKTDSTEPPRYDGLPLPRRHYATATVISAISLTVLDASSVTVALPEIARSLDTSPATVVWIANVYNLTVLTLLLPLSAVTDRIGFKRMFVAGLLLCLGAACVAALSASTTQLLTARIFQGVGAAMLSCLFGGLVRHTYPIAKLGHGISLNAMVVGFAAVLGPVIGSAILSIASWHWIFLLNLPLGVLALAGVRSLPNPPTSKARFDVTAALLSMAALGLFIYGLDDLVQRPLPALGLVGLAVLLAIVLLRHTRAQPAPLVPVDLLAHPVIGFAVASAALIFAAQMGTSVALPFLFLHVMQRDYLEVGLLMGGWPIGGALTAPLAGRLSDRHSAALLSALGAGVMALGLLLLLLVPTDASTVWLLGIMILTGIGFGFFQSPNNRAILASAPRHRSAAAGGMQATTRVFGQSVGIASVSIAFGLSETAGATLGLGAALGFASLAMAVNVVRLRRERLP